MPGFGDKTHCFSTTYEIKASTGSFKRMAITAYVLILDFVLMCPNNINISTVPIKL